MSLVNIRKYKPVTPGLRHKIKLIQPERTSSEEYKRMVREGLIVGRKTSRGGRNEFGRVTVRGRGGAHKRRLRIIDRARLMGEYTRYIVEREEYNPSITGKMLVVRADAPEGKRWNILGVAGLKPGDIIEGSKYSDIIGEEGTVTIRGRAGEVRKLKDIVQGVRISNIEGKYIRAAGAYGTLERKIEDKDGIKCEIRLPSGEKKIWGGEIKATIGQVGNEDHSKEVLGKAGSSRRIGIRPIVRGEARNPVDHPHGGKSHGSGGKGNAARNVWGKLAKWVPTR